jgi:hypothetical protein
MSTSDGGKGSKQRPVADKQKFDNNWDTIFSGDQAIVPDNWEVIKIVKDGNTIYRVLAGWIGNYTQGRSWRLNSGIKSVTDKPTYYIFHGYSGSKYRCYKKLEGLDWHTQDILDALIKNSKKTGIKITPVTMKEALGELHAE